MKEMRLPIPRQVVKSPWVPFKQQYSTKNPHCGCPWEDRFKHCFHCRSPDQLEVRILYPPTKCVKQPCGFQIPAITCNEFVERKPVKDYVYDLTVDTPGPNDSYGLNGLNWWDWRMDEYNSKAFPESKKNTNVPDHPYLSKASVPHGFPKVLCELPIDCYSRTPGWVSSTNFKQPVNYSRDWRCCSAKPPSPWKPPRAGWATNQHL